MNPTPPNPEALPWRPGGRVSSNVPESHAVGSIATVRVSMSNTSRIMTQSKRNKKVLQVMGLNVR